MASRAFLVAKTFARQFLKFRGLKNVPQPNVSAVVSKPITRAVKTIQPRRTIWELGRYIFRTPQLFRRGPFAPIRLGLCIGLAISNNDSIQFREIRDVANTCLLKSSLTQGRNWEFSSLRQLEFGKFLNKGCQGAVYAARPADDSKCEPPDISVESQDYPLIMKMLFNYQEENRQMGNQLDEDIVHSFKAETVPLSYLPPHPSIAKVHGAVVDKVPELPEAESHFPCALPPSLYPNLRSCCYGEEKTLFLLMHRYSSSLYERLKEGALTVDQTMQVLLQLLEGDLFLKKHGIAHRDLHAKNVLLEESAGGIMKACISDFGCATDKVTRKSPQCLKLETTPGIPSLQAPEVTDPNLATSLDYRKADLWAIATLVYEMRRPGHNPFTTKGGLDSRNYSNEDLPVVSDVPLWLDTLVRQMLRKNPRERPSSELCANIVHLMLLRIPMSWIIGEEPTTKQIEEWIELRLVGLIMNHKKSHIDLFHLMFCKRITELELRKCLRWLRQQIVDF